MSLRKLPEAQVFARPQNYQWDAPSDVLTKWAEHPLAAVPDADGDTTISMFDVIGEDGWSGGGVTVSRISAALRSIGSKDITVRINSPGGDMFEGIAIYNLLRAHPAQVTVEVLGDRKSVVEGKRVKLGGRRTEKKRRAKSNKRAAGTQDHKDTKAP